MNPWRTSTSSAQGARSLIDHSGARNAPTADGAAAPSRLERRATRRELIREPPRAELVHARVGVPVRPDLVTRGADVGDELGMALRDPADDEEGAPHVTAGGQV